MLEDVAEEPVLLVVVEPAVVVVAAPDVVVLDAAVPAVDVPLPAGLLATNCSSAESNAE